MTGTEEKEFQNFWNRLNQIDLGQFVSLNIAIRRFNDAYERERLEDKLIDHMIAFEALYFKEGEMGEFRHKLAVRSARFLKQSYEDRKEIIRQMKEFYDKRSKIVHGEKVTLNKKFINDVEDHLRNSIKRFIERIQTSNHDAIISHLDLD
ncbi:MAG: hypothetical protein ACE5I5_05105 [Candidatus Heimdallarchaeota archaeon]